MQRDLKNEIIETSFRMFREKGYDNVTVQDICRELKITKPTFYNYVASKDSLISDFFEQVTPDLAKQILAMSDDNNYFEQILKSYNLIFSHALKFGLDLFRQLYISNLRENKGTFTFQSEIAELISELIQKAQESGEIHNTIPANELFSICSTFFIGYSVVWCIEDGALNLNYLLKNGLIQLLQVDSSLL